MPVHDWTRVNAGIFHAFHQGWTIHLSEALNGGVLPAGYYALPDQVAGGTGLDVLTLHDGGANGAPGAAGAGGVALLTPPRTRFTATLDDSFYLSRRKSVTIRHVSDDRVVALVEIVWPGNKAGEYPMLAFLTKVADALHQRVNVLVIDLLPPTPRDPRGLHSAVWELLGGPPFHAPTGEPLTLASYSAAVPLTAHVETTAVGRALADMPLFLTAGAHVLAPLEATYRLAWDGLAGRWRAAVEGA